MGDRLGTMATIGIAGLSGALVIAALMITGGPVTARMEYRDMIRLQDLRAISQHVSCAMTNDIGPLPDRPKAVSGCGMVPRMQDPFTAAPYRYEVLDPRTIRLCAGFELPPMPDQSPDEESVGAGPDCRDFRIWRPDLTQGPAGATDAD